jgi:multiple sugar transport system ATP-binding protein
MGFALQLAKVPSEEIAKRVAEAARILDLEPFLQRKPRAMSGGQRQRVAMGRAIVRKPQVFCMDEPLSNLDAKLRVQTRTQIAKLQRDLGVTTVYVTHDQTEAMTMGDRVAVMKDGLLQQVGTPRELYDTPNNIFVAGFIGSPAMNTMEVVLTENGVMVGETLVPIKREMLDAASRRGVRNAIFGFRPEDTGVDPGSAGIPVYVSAVESLGSDAYVYGQVTLIDGTKRDVSVRTDGRHPPKWGDTVYIHISEDHQHLFDPVSGERIG